ncbi:hypothetical protein EIN_165390 [Entamoeba invadens IP1]|uniref:TLDc domain-containing protein n=1 Tax=Entamoeba invadens IP1 TaxID=370355 RepID=A0A0A1UA98_ENTIV|nr:hypothetical protein EIN_165390 [Entamoeba invadens IP1]ELP89069.1 hypothetical protein EIN_165390 [Entamoeba invadens IP1]|eukprot:XP_004255840.1 hypothetical protein EIN_165390 [Entamoeba invadens IP1]
MTSLLTKLLELSHKEHIRVVYDTSYDAYDRKVINSKLSGQTSLLICVISEEKVFGYYTESQVPRDDDTWKAVGVANAFAFIYDESGFRLERSRSCESCLYINVDNDDDEILLSVRHFFFLRREKSYLSGKFNQFFGFLNKEVCYPYYIHIQNVIIYKLYYLFLSFCKIIGQILDLLFF